MFTSTGENKAVNSAHQVVRRAKISSLLVSSKSPSLFFSIPSINYIGSPYMAELEDTLGTLDIV
jgi:hypothetical protein